MSVTVTRNVIDLTDSGRRGRPGLLAAANSAETLLSLVDGGGSSSLAVTPLYLGDVVEALGVMLNRMRFLRPTKSKPYTAVKMSADRWWVLTFVKDGNRQDYAIHEFVNRGATQSPAITDCWSYNGCVAYIDGIYEEFANFTGENVGAGVMDSLPPPIWEPVFRCGPHTGGTFDYIGPGHGHIQAPTSAIYLNGSTATNYREPANSPVGTVLRGTAFLIDQSFTAYLPDNTTPIGSYNFAHIMVEGGVQVSGGLTVTGTNIGMTTFFGAMLSGRPDMVKPNGVTAIAADREDGLEYGAGAVPNASLGECHAMQLYNAARPTHILESIVIETGPMDIDSAGYSWAANDSNRDTFLQDRTEGYAKVYTHGVNKAASWLVDGKTFAFNVTYRVRSGSLI